MTTRVDKPDSRVDSRTDQGRQPIDRELRFLRFPMVRARTGLSRSTIWRLEQRGAFPRHRRISRNAVAWVEDEVLEWMQSKLQDGA